MTPPAVVGHILHWIEGALHPVATMNGLLCKTSSRGSAVPLSNEFIGYLSASLILSALVQVPVLQVYGVAWSNVGYQGLNIATQFLYLFFQALAAHLLISTRGRESDFWKTFVICSSPALAYLPITNFLALKNLSGSLDIFKEVKQQHLGIWTSLPFFFDAAKRHTPDKAVYPLLGAVLLSISATLNVFSQTLTAEAISQYYDLKRFDAYSLVATAGFLVIVLDVIFLGSLDYLTTFAFITVS